MEMSPCSHLIGAACWTALSGGQQGSGSSSPSTSTLPPSSLVCPLCAAPVTSCRPNKAIELIISRWEVSCPYHPRGCPHLRTSLGKDEANLQSHLDRCDFVPLPCPHCSRWVERRSRVAHEAHRCPARFLSCPHCQAPVLKEAEQQRLHSQNTIDPSLPCVNLRRCPYGCLLTAGPTTSPSGRAVKRRRDDDGGEGSGGAEEAQTVPSPRPSVMPHWMISSHLPVCPLHPLVCGVCSASIPRSQITSHFTANHPSHPLIVQEDGHDKGDQVEQRKKVEVNGQVAVNHRGVQAMESAETHRMAPPPSTPPHPQTRSFYSLSTAPASPHTPAPPSPPSYSARASAFESLLSALPCVYCGKARGLLLTPGGVPCTSSHPNERLLTLEGRYFCCGRVKGSEGCQMQVRHDFDMRELKGQFPDFSERCHPIKSGQGGGSGGRGAGPVGLRLSGSVQPGGGSGGGGAGDHSGMQM